MPTTVVHSKVSVKSDGADAALVRPSDWNAGHVVTMASGSILQKVFSQTNTETTTTSSSYVDTALTLNITPSVASNPILIIASANLITNAAGIAIHMGVMRGGSAGTRIGQEIKMSGSSVVQGMGVVLIQDSPGSTSAITYTAVVRNTDGATVVGFTLLSGASACASMIALELQA